MRLLTAVSGVRVPQQAPENTSSRGVFSRPVWGHEPRRFARFRRSRNDTADTALDAIGTPCNDRYSVTSFLTGVRVPQQAPFERNCKSGFFLFLKSFSNPLTLFSPCTTFACRSDGENSLFRHFVPYGGSSPSRGLRRKYFRWGCFRRQKAPHLEVFFLALFGDMPPARFARFRRSRNDTADTALDAIGTPCSDRYSVTSFLTKEVLYLLSYISVSMILTVCGDLRLPAFLPLAGFTKIQPERKGALPAAKYPFQISKTPQYLVLFLPPNFSGCQPFPRFDSQIQPIRKIRTFLGSFT